MKKNGFTLIELIVIIAIIAMLLAMLVPAMKKIAGKAEEIMAEQKAVVVVMKTDTAAVKVDILHKIELRPDFSGPKVQVYLSNVPEGAEIIAEGSKYYLLWTPHQITMFTTTVITAAPPNLTKEREITIMVTR